MQLEAMPPQRTSYRLGARAVQPSFLSEYGPLLIVAGLGAAFVFLVLVPYARQYGSGFQAQQASGGYWDPVMPCWVYW